MDEEQERLDRMVQLAKKNCKWCYSHRGLSPTEKEKTNTQKVVLKLAEEYQGKYDSLRKEDADAEEILAAQHNKRYCWDMAETCKKCERDVDRVNRALNDLK